MCERDLAHEADMRKLRKEQLEADIDDEELDFPDSGWDDDDEWFNDWR